MALVVGKPYHQQLVLERGQVCATLAASITFRLMPDIGHEVLHSPGDERPGDVLSR